MQVIQYAVGIVLSRYRPAKTFNTRKVKVASIKTVAPPRFNAKNQKKAPTRATASPYLCVNIVFSISIFACMFWISGISKGPSIFCKGLLDKIFVEGCQLEIRYWNSKPPGILSLPVGWCPSGPPMLRRIYWIFFASH